MTVTAALPVLRSLVVALVVRNVVDGCDCRLMSTTPGIKKPLSCVQRLLSVVHVCETHTGVPGYFFGLSILIISRLALLSCFFTLLILSSMARFSGVIPLLLTIILRTSPPTCCAV